MMECTSCRKRKIGTDFSNFKLCKKCFIKIMESRMKKEFRNLGNEEKLLPVRRVSLLKFIIKKLIKNPGIKIVRKNPTKTVFGNTLEEEISSFFSKDFRKREFIMPFRNIMENELEQYARINNVKLEKVKKEMLEREFENMFNKLEEKRPGAKFSVLKSIDRINGILRDNEKI